MRFWFGFGLAILFLWLIVRKIGFSELAGAITEARLPVIGFAVVIFFAGYACRIERWRVMLAIDKPELRWSACAGPLMASVAANNVLPFRAGDLVRAFGFNRRLGITVATSLTTLLVERLLDLLMIVLFMVGVSAFFSVDLSRYFLFGFLILSSAGFVILFLLLFPSVFKPLAFGAAKFVSRLRLSLGDKIQTGLVKVFTALDHTSSGHVMGKLIFWSLLAWLAEGFVFLLVALSLSSLSHPQASWLALSLGTLATAIPGTPGYVGTFDFFVAKAMNMLGNPEAASAAFAFLVHIVLWLPPSLAGGLYLLVSPVRDYQNSPDIAQ